MVVAVDGDATGVRGEHAEDDSHGRCLAGTVGSDEPGHLAVVDAEAQVVQDLFVAEAAVDVLEGDHGSTLCGAGDMRISRAGYFRLSVVGEINCVREAPCEGMDGLFPCPPV